MARLVKRWTWKAKSIKTIMLTKAPGLSFMKNRRFPQSQIELMTQRFDVTSVSLNSMDSQKKNPNCLRV